MVQSTNTGKNLSPVVANNVNLTYIIEQVWPLGTGTGTGYGIRALNLIVGMGGSGCGSI